MTSEEDGRRGVDACLFFTVAICALLAASVKTLHPTEFAFNYWDTYKQVDDSLVYTQGRHFLMVGHSFIKFPSNEVKLDVTEMTLRTHDGLSVTSNIDFWYKFDPETAMQVYYEFGDGYEDIFRLMVRAELRDIAAKFSSTQLVSQRHVVAENMEQGIREMLGNLNNGASVIVTKVFLKSIWLPDEYNGAIAKTVEAEQDVLTAKSEVRVALIAAETKTQEAVISSETFELSSQATAESTRAEATAFASVTVKEAATRASSYAELKKQAADADVPATLTSDDLLAYIFLDGLRSNYQSPITIGLAEPAAL